MQSRTLWRVPVHPSILTRLIAARRVPEPVPVAFKIQKASIPVARGRSTRNRDADHNNTRRLVGSPQPPPELCFRCKRRRLVLRRRKTHDTLALPSVVWCDHGHRHDVEGPTTTTGSAHSAPTQVDERHCCGTPCPSSDGGSRTGPREPPAEEESEHIQRRDLASAQGTRGGHEQTAGPQHQSYQFCDTASRSTRRSASRYLGRLSLRVALRVPVKYRRSLVAIGRGERRSVECRHAAAASPEAREGEGPELRPAIFTPAIQGQYIQHFCPELSTASVSTRRVSWAGT